MYGIVFIPPAVTTLPQATLKETPTGPRSAVTMQKSIMTAFGSTGFLYLTIACLGYAALGSTVPGDVLVGFSVSKEVREGTGEGCGASSEAGGAGHRVKQGGQAPSEA